MNRRKLQVALAVLGPVVVLMCVWTLIACLQYLDGPPGGGGVEVSPTGAVKARPPEPSPTRPLVLSAITLPLSVVYLVVFLKWRKAKAEGEGP